MSKTSGKLIRVLMVEDHQLVRAALALLLEQQMESLTVVGQAMGCDEAVDAARSQRPDVVLLDLDLGSESGLDCIPRLQQECPSASILVLTGVNDPASCLKAVQLGVRGIVSKESGPDAIVSAIERVSQGSVWLDSALMPDIVRQISGSARVAADPDRLKLEQLTAREHEVVALVAQGLKNRAISEQLYVSETTVRHHLTSIFSKLGVSNRVQLVLFAYRTGIASPPGPRFRD